MVINRVLAVGAHPDDIEILCGGTLARYAAMGADVTILTVTNGEKGSLEQSPEAIAEIRRRECRQASEVIGANWASLGITDGQVVWNEDLHIAMIRAIQDADPDIIITHSPADYASDHTETSKAVVNAGFYSPCRQFAGASGKPSRVVAPLYFMDTICGVGFVPHEYVDITETIETKLEMYSKHISQHNFLKDRDSFDAAESITISGSYRGFQCGCRYAEGFRLYKTWPRLKTHRLLP